MEILVSIPQFIDLKGGKEDVNIERSSFTYYPLSYSRKKKKERRKERKKEKNKQPSAEEHSKFNSDALEKSYTRLLLADAYPMDNPHPWPPG